MTEPISLQEQIEACDMLASMCADIGMSKYGPRLLAAATTLRKVQTEQRANHLVHGVNAKCNAYACPVCGGPSS